MTVEVYHDSSPDFSTRVSIWFPILDYYIVPFSCTTTHLLFFPFSFFFWPTAFLFFLFFFHSLIPFPLLFSPLATRPISSHHGQGAASSHTSSHRLWLIKQALLGCCAKPTWKPCPPQQFPYLPTDRPCFLALFSSAVKSKKRRRKRKSVSRSALGELSYLARATEIWSSCTGVRSVGTYLGSLPSVVRWW